MSENNARSGATKQQAMACAQANRIGEALDLYLKVCEADPRDAESWYMAGALYGRLGRAVEAEAALRKALSLQPGFAPGYLNLGQALELQGKLAEAGDSYRRALALKADFADAHHALGLLSQRRGDMRAAVTHLQKAVQLNPSRVPPYLALAKVFISIAELDAAAESIDHVLQLDVNNVPAYFELARVRMYQGQYDAALQAIDIVLRLKPDDVEARVMEANLLAHLHDYQGALDRLTPLMESCPDHPGVALVYARLVQFTKDHDGAIARLESLIAKDDLSGLPLTQIHFNLGQLYDKRGAFDRAFAHYEAGNKLAAAHFDPREWEDRITTVINTFNHEALQRAPRAGNSSQRPIFIVGMPRSGTTLVEQIFSMYPGVAAAGELPDMDMLAHEFGKMLETTSPANDITQVTREQCDSLAQRYLDMLAGKYPTALRVTDKMPHNFLNLGLITLLFPKARVIHCLRDPLDTCLSCYFQMFPAYHAYASDLADLGAYYRQYQRLMNHWRAVVDIPVFEVRYEDLVRDPETLGRAMVEFCGLDWDPRCLEFYKSERSVATASSQQVRQPIYSSSMERWRHYAEYLEPLRKALAGQ